MVIFLAVVASDGTYHYSAGKRQICQVVPAATAIRVPSGEKANAVAGLGKSANCHRRSPVSGFHPHKVRSREAETSVLPSAVTAMHRTASPCLVGHSKSVKGLSRT